MPKKVLLIISHEGYQEVEYNDTKQALENAGITVTTASDKAETATAKDGSTTPVDIVLDSVNVKDYDGIFIIGGSGPMTHLDNETTYKIMQQAATANKPIGAICISTRILAHAGLLGNKRATGWNGDGELDSIYTKYNVDYLKDKDVVVDGNIITATGPHAAKNFGKKIIELVK